MFEEFRKFALRGNVVDMAVGIIIGGAFGTIVSSLVNDVLMPPIGLLFAGVNFSNIFIVLRQGAEVAGPYATVAAAREAGAVTMNVGMFINAVVSFTLVAIAVFMVVRTLNAAKRKEAAAPAPPPAPSAQETLLGEIRDLLKARV